MKNVIPIIIIISLLFSCDKEEETTQLKELPGSWVWIQGCGGVTGGCIYPDKDNYKSIEITQDRFLQKINGVVTINDSYEVTKLEIGPTNYPYEKNYELKLGDGTIIGMTFLQHKDRLSTSGDSFYLDSYKRD